MCWSHDFSALLTAGEDGVMKLWSRSYMLRSALVRVTGAIYAAAWSPSSTSVLYASGQQLCVKPLQPNTNTTAWRAHDGLILCVAWNSANKNILSSAEDCRYRVWDARGVMLYSSTLLSSPVTAVDWSRSGQLLALASCSTVRLANQLGSSHTLFTLDPTSPVPSGVAAGGASAALPSGVGAGGASAAVSSGVAAGGASAAVSSGVGAGGASVIALAWSPDGTQLALASSSGHVHLTHVVGGLHVWREYEALAAERSVIRVRDCVQSTTEQLELQHSVTVLAFNYGHLVAVAASSCSVYSVSSWNTPVIVPLKQPAAVHLVLQSPRLFALVDLVCITLYTYDGRVANTVRWPGLRAGALTPLLSSLSDDTLACAAGDASDTVVQLVDCVSGRAVSQLPYTHSERVTSLCLNQQQLPAASAAAAVGSRLLALLDDSCNIYVLHARRQAEDRDPQLLAVMCSSMCFHCELNMLVAVQDTRLCVWLYPSAVYIDRQVLPSTVLVRETQQLARGGSCLLQFDEHVVRLRARDGATVVVPVSPYAAALHRAVAAQVTKGQQGERGWTTALRLCRFAKMSTLWSCLAAMAIASRETITARTSYAAIGMLHKVEYLRYIEETADVEVRDAELSLLLGNVAAAETSLVRAGHAERAVAVHTQLHNWQRALELVVRHNLSPSTLMAQRAQYLARFGLKESDQLFLQFKKRMKESQIKRATDSLDEDQIPEELK